MKKRVNIGLIIFLGIFLYFAANIFSYVTRDQVSYCEVEPGKIVSSDSFTGFILRNESTVNAPESGYINYFINNGDKAAINSNICMIRYSQDNSSENISSDGDYAITDSDYTTLREQVNIFRKGYTDSSYSDIYNLDYQLGDLLSRIISRNNINTADSTDSYGRYTVMSASESGIISYTYDGMESYGTENITPDLFASRDYGKTQLSAGTYVERATPAYKIIYDDYWKIILLPTQDLTDRLSEGDTVYITLVRDDITVPATVSFFVNDGASFVCLDLSNYMIRYYNDRYIDVEIEWSSYEGLKIPSSSVTTKDFLMIPVSYLVTEEGSSESGFYIRGEDGIEFVKPVIYRQTDDYCYLDCADMDIGTLILDPDTGTSYRAGTTAALEGVYQINKGYARFRLIDILYEDGDYCIINSNTKYGVTIYDHILLDGSSAVENEIITN